MKLYIAVLLCTGLLILAPVALAAGRPPRIAVMRLRHETVTFLPNDTTRDDFIYPGSPARGEALLNSESRGAMGGFVKVAREYGAELTGIESPGMPRTGTGSGWVTQDAYEHFVGRMLAGLKEQGPFDGVYLNLHGAMAVRGIPRPEAELARRVREVVGDGVVIVGTFDPHGNEDEAFLQHADLAFTYKYYPHYDTYLQGKRAARMLFRTIRGDYQPAHAVRTVPILSATVYQWTGQHPWSTLVQRCLTWEAREPDVYVNFFEEFEVFAIKSRVHFRRDFDDNGFAKTILLVEPPGKHMGTVHLDALPYENLRVTDYFPFSKASGE